MNPGQALPAKSVLLIDINERTCESRAKILRTFGVLVDTATTAATGLGLFQAGAYNLVLIHLGGDVAGAERLARDIRAGKPRQQVAFLVGSPLFVATSPRSAPPRPRPHVDSSKPEPNIRTLPAPMDFAEMVKLAEAAQQKNNQGE